MAGALWVSDKGIRRKGTSFREVQNLFIEQITTKYIYEPLYAASVSDDPIETKNDLIARDFDVVGVISTNQKVVGYIKAGELENDKPIESSLRIIDLSLVATDSTPIYELIKLLETRTFVFVMHGNSIDGIVTLADLNKPIVRLYLFGVISLFEMHMNYWIEHYHPIDSWQSKLKEQRLKLASETHDRKRKNNQALSLLACLQFADKREILSQAKDFLQRFNLSKNKFEWAVTKAEDIRNELAHSQATINAGIEWNKFVNVISELESFLEKSEEAVDGR